MLRVQPSFSQRWSKFFQRLRRQHNRQPTLLPVLAVVSFMTIALFLFLVISGTADQKPPLSRNIHHLLQAERPPDAIVTEEDIEPQEQQETPTEEDVPGRLEQGSKLDVDSVYRNKIKSRRDMRVQGVDRSQTEQGEDRGGDDAPLPVPPHIARHQQRMKNKRKDSVDSSLQADTFTEDPASPPSPSPSPPAEGRHGSRLRSPRRPSRPPLSSSVYASALDRLQNELQVKIAASEFEECILLREMIQRVERDQSVAQSDDNDSNNNDHTPGNNQRMDNNEIGVEDYLDQVKKQILGTPSPTPENNNEEVQSSQIDSHSQPELEERKDSSWEKENEPIQPAEDPLSIPTPSAREGSLSRLQQQVKTLSERPAAGEEETLELKEETELARKKKRMRQQSKRTRNEKKAQMPLPGELQLDKDEQPAAATIRAPLEHSEPPRVSTPWPVTQEKRDVVVSPEEVVQAVHEQQHREDGGVDARHSHISQELFVPVPTGPLSNLTVVWELASGYCSPASIEAIWLITALANKVTLGIIMDETQLCLGLPDQLHSLLLALRHQPMSQWEIDVFITSQSPTHYPSFPYHGEVALSNNHVPDYIISRTSSDVDRINQAWRVQILNLVDELWLSSSQQQIKAFTDAGIESSMIQTFATPVDTSLFNPARSFSTAHLPVDFSHLKMYNLLSIIQPWTIQQGWQILTEAFVKEFFMSSDGDDVSLYIYTYREEEQEQHQVPRDVQYVQIEEWMKNYVETLNVSRSTAALANIHIVTADIPYIQLPALYAAFDAFVLPIKHDGAVLPILQAMSMSVPCVVPQNVLEHVTNDNALLIELTAKEQAIGAGYVRGQNWANPSVSSLQRQLRYAVTHPEQMRALGDKARATVMQHHTIAGVTTQIVQRLAEVQEIVWAKKKLLAATGIVEAAAPIE